MRLLNERAQKTSWRWVLLLLVLAQGMVTQAACGYVAAGAAGAVVGHEIADDDDSDDAN